MNDILKKNFDYFNKEILPYYFIIQTSLGDIIIDVNEKNLKHLLGINKSDNIKYSQMSSYKLYQNLSCNSLSFFDIINADRYKDNNLYEEEKHILYKNLYFIQLFDNLIRYPSIHRIYTHRDPFAFDADYVHFCIINECGGYIGIVSSENHEYYHYFNSILYEMRNPEKYKGSPLIVYQIKRVEKKSFQLNLYNPIKSRRYKYIKSDVKNKNKKIDLKKTIKDISKILEPEYRLKLGVNGKNTIQITKNGKIVEQRYKPTLDLQTAEEIAQDIQLKF